MIRVGRIAYRGSFGDQSAQGLGEGEVADDSRALRQSAAWYTIFPVQVVAVVAGLETDSEVAD